VEKRFLAILQQAVAAENAARSTKEGAITVEPKLIGDRPAGQTPRDAQIVQFAAAAYAHEGLPIRYGAGSTDSNIPISLGFPQSPFRAWQPAAAVIHSTSGFRWKSRKTFGSSASALP
jgi:hypothetical protein